MHRRRRLACGDRLEVPPRQTLDNIGVHVPHDRHHRVVRRVVASVVVFQVSPGDPLEVAHVPDHRLTVRMCLEGLGEVALVERAPGARVHPHPTLLENHVSLRVEFPEHRVLHAVRLQREPKLQAVGRELHVIDRGLGSRGGVQPLSALAGENAIERVAFHMDPCRVLQDADTCCESRHRDRIAGFPGGKQGFVNGVDAIEVRALRFEVPGAQRIRTLEEHVLE